ncbi:hypothetical protein Mapa_001752 [Marchantia paleacea]|nr:hypothetical protein Mapa_001752 [Marchantia paleacea]
MNYFLKSRLVDLGILQLLDGHLANAESFHEHVIGNTRLEENVGKSVGTWVRAAESHQSLGKSLSSVDLEVNQTLWEHDGFTFANAGGEELVGGVDDTHIEASLHAVEQLGTTGVSVRRVQSSGGELQQRRGDA